VKHTGVSLQVMFLAISSSAALPFIFLHISYSFHDGSLNFYRPDTTGVYAGSTITGLNSPKVSSYR